MSATPRISALHAELLTAHETATALRDKLITDQRTIIAQQDDLIANDSAIIERQRVLIGQLESRVRELEGAARLVLLIADQNGVSHDDFVAMVRDIFGALTPETLVPGQSDFGEILFELDTNGVAQTTMQ